MGAQLAPAVPDMLAIDVNLVLFAEGGVGPCFEIGFERVSGPAALGVDLGPCQEVTRRKVRHGPGLEVDDCRDPSVVGEDDVREAVAQGWPPRPGSHCSEGLVVTDL